MLGIHATDVHIFSSLQDVACHQPKALVAEIESRQWCCELHLGRFEARILLVKVLCCAFFPGQDGKLFLWHISFISSIKCIYTRHVFMLFSSPQDVASHQPKELVARIERDEWSGELHRGRFEARIVLVKVFCCVFFPLVRMTSYFCGLSSTRTVRVLFFPHLLPSSSASSSSFSSTTSASIPPQLPPCQLFAKLFANFPAQCASLDLNLGPSQLSVHRWTSTWDLPSSVCTAGPQPGTFPAQCAPLDLNLGPSQLSVHRWTSAWDLPSSVPEDMPDKMP